MADQTSGIVLPTRRRGNDPILTVSPALREDNSVDPTISRITREVPALESPHEVLEVLKSKPSLDQLKKCLEFLDKEQQHDAAFDKFHVRLLGPIASQIVFVLVNEIVPSYWPLLSTTQNLRREWKSLIRCLRSVAGIGAVLTRLKALCRTSVAAGEGASSETQLDQAQLLAVLQLLECILHGDKTVDAIWQDTVRLESKALRQPMTMDQLSSFIAGGAVLSAAAEAAHKIEISRETAENKWWVGDGQLYAWWLGRNILAWSLRIERDKDEAGAKARGRLLSRSLSLGYTEGIVSSLFEKSLQGDERDLPACKDMLLGLTDGFQWAILSAVLRKLAARAPRQHSIEFIGGSAALLHRLVTGNARLQHHLVKWLTDVPGGSASYELDIFRAVVACLGEEPGLLKKAHAECLRRFGSKLSIKQDPTLLQERHAQILLLMTGKLFAIDQQYVRGLKHSSDFLDAISNRLAASSSRSQFLGMVVGTAISTLIDDKDSKLNFSQPDVDGSEGKSFRELATISDNISKIGDLAALSDKPSRVHETARVVKSVKSQVKAEAPRSTNSGSKIIAIEEVSDDESDDFDLPVYAKPDSDPEDEDEDPTLINRNKPTAPVYIRDLLSGLRDDDNYERHKLAIETAPGLIRRKAAFGTEVSDHLEELASAIVGLDDKFDIETHNSLRLQSTIALVVAAPARMGPWFANTFFNGDYSMSQRASILTTLALAARELAGFKDEDAHMTGANSVPNFPSKRLPARAEAAYLSMPTPVTRVAGRLEREVLQPLALSAADAATGPSVLKVRTFSSRLDPAKQAARTRTVPNKLSKLVADSFFFPLTSRWRSVLSVRGSRGHVFTEPFILSQFVRTLALILAAAGAGTLSLQAMTAEFWPLLLALRGQAAGEVTVTEGLLFAFLMLLEVNASRSGDVARDFAEEIGQTKDWVQNVWDNTRGGAKEEDRIRVLSAGVMVKAEELIESYRKQVFGEVL